MNSDAIGAVAELLGALRVIASLSYLAVRIRQNTRSAREAAWHSVLHDLQQFRSLIAQDDCAPLDRWVSKESSGGQSGKSSPRGSPSD